MRKGLLSPELSPPSLQIFQQIKSQSTALIPRDVQENEGPSYKYPSFFQYVDNNLGH